MQGEKSTSCQGVIRGYLGLTINPQAKTNPAVCCVQIGKHNWTATLAITSASTIVCQGDLSVGVLNSALHLRRVVSHFVTFSYSPSIVGVDRAIQN